MRENRAFQRVDVSIPCLVFCEDRVITGDITNLSLGGAFISQASDSLTVGLPVILTLQSKPDIKVRVTIDSKIIHRSQEVRGDDQIKSFGVKFEESLSGISDKLAFILRE